MRNIVLVMSYDGTDFQGWQTQPGHRTVQETLQTAITDFTGEKRVRLKASGRTDAGVHAVGQVANFFTMATYSCNDIVRALNSRLPEDVVVRHASEANLSFNASDDAKWKLYRYVIHDGDTPDPMMRRYCYHIRRNLDAVAMHRACQYLKGTHDYHSFETKWPNRMSSVRTVSHIAVNRVGEYLWIDVDADGFLYNMVRGIAGTLINVGRGQLRAEQVAEILNAQDRRVAGFNAPAQGLFLMRVTYE